MDARVEDYLSDKLQTEADLDSLDTLLETAKQHQALLKKQLDEANQNLRDASNASAEYEETLQSEISTFQGGQADIDSRLRKLTQSDTSDKAVQKFEKTLATLGRLDVASLYLDLFQEVDKLSSSARGKLRIAPREALSNYVQLRSILLKLKEAQPAAEGAAPHLVDHVELEASNLQEQMRNAFAEGLEKTLDQLSWPNKELKIDDQVMKRWTEQVELLFDLQEPDLRAQNINATGYETAQAPAVLLPIQVMVHPLDLRFRYHFNGDKPTNRPDKPEYFLSHVIDLLEAHADFFVEFFQPVLDRRVNSIDAEINLAYTDATIAFTTALLPMVRQKCLNLLPQIADNPQLLSHFIHELMEFDATLRDIWGYIPTSSPLDTWRGLTWEMLVTHGYFNAWLQGEKTFALDRYHNIIASPDSGDIDYDSPLPGTTKPTKGAIRVNDLLETITDRYRPLSSFSQKLRFLIDIQLEIFDQYHQRLHESLEAYLTMTSAIGRTMAGSAGKDSAADLSGTKGLDRLCRVFGSAEYLEKKMLDWSDDVFFLELWDELQDRAQRNSGTNRPVARELSDSQIASKTSADVVNGGISDTDNSKSDGGALFDETASAFKRLRTRSESIIIESLESAIRNSLRSYSRISTWSSLTDSSTANTNSSNDPGSSAVSPELSGPLQVLDTYLEFLSRVLSRSSLRRITRQVCLALQSYLWDYVLMRNTFSVGGATTFRADVFALDSVIDEYVGSGVAPSHMAKVHEALLLLCLPAATGATGNGSSGEPDDDWGFEDEGNEAANANAAQNLDSASADLMDAHSATWSLWSVERLVFKSNESAREALRQMDLGVITSSEARGVLERRVELQK